MIRDKTAILNYTVKPAMHEGGGEAIAEKEKNEKV